MRKLVLLILVCLVMVLVCEARGRGRSSFVSLNYTMKDLDVNTTTYSLTTSTHQPVVIQARKNRVDGAYVINLGTPPVYITTVRHSTSTSNPGAHTTCDEFIRTNGTYLYGSGTLDGFPTPASAYDADSNIFYLLSDEKYYVLSGDDVTSALTYNLRVFDVWSTWE